MELAQEQSTRVGYKEILKQKSYVLYMIATLISRFGDSIDSIAYSWMVYELTGSAALMATLFGFNAIPNIIFQPIAGVLVDYRSKKKILSLCNWGRGLIVAITAAMFLTGKLQVYHLFIFTFMNSTLEALQSPASSAIIPLILDKEHFAYGQALRGTASTVVELVGLGLAGFIIASIGISGALFIDAMTFGVCGLLIIFLKHKKERLKEEKISMKGYKDDLVDGFKYLYSHKLIFHIALFGAALNAFLSPYSSLAPAYVGESLNLGPEGISTMGICLTLGMMLGSIIFPKLKGKIQGINLFIGGGVVLGSWYFILSGATFIHSEMAIYSIISLGCIVGGMSVSVISMLVQIAFMERVEQEYLGRAAGVMNSMMMCAMPLGAFFIGSISLLINIQTIYILAGAFIIILFIVQKFNKHLQNI